MKDLHIVLDTGALVSLRGNPLVSRLVYQATSSPGTRLYAASCALVEADRTYPGLAEHVAQLPAVDILPLDLSAALNLCGTDGWGLPHTLHVARPTAERPHGAVVATINPADWQGRPVRVLSLAADG
ncbi:hypothetical protein [Streptomyces sp. enrichment culture]|uniref:hypothetical protein n=1 Tax=Streptomyces sp. enrichment culture TaxID=1795815 RepID=UPI003F56E7C4